MRKRGKTKSESKWSKSDVAALENAVGQAWHRRRSAWRSRPRLHTAIFAEAWHYDQIEEKLLQLGEKIQDPELYEAVRQEQKRKVKEKTENLNWNDDRLSLFKKLVAEYRQDRSVARYLCIRQTFPEVEIQVAEFAGIDPLFALEEDFKKQGINPDLVAAALDSDEPAIDALCLHIMELVVARNALPKSGPGSIEKRRQAINDPTINYLIMTMLEGYDWHNDDVGRIPASLIVLIRHQFFAGRLDLHQQYLSKERQENIALSFGQSLRPADKVSINRLARMMDLPRSTAARWLADSDFRERIEQGRRWAQEGRSEQAMAAYRERLGLPPKNAGVPPKI